MCPVIGLVVAEDTKELFDFLVDIFCLSIGSRVIGNGQGLFNVKLVSSFSHEFEGELGASV